MFIIKTQKQVEAENAEIVRKNREHDDRVRAANTPYKRISKATTGAQRLLKRLERDGGEPAKKGREIVSRMIENQKVYFDCEAELAKTAIRHQDVARAQAVTELLKKLPNCFPCELDAVHFAEQLTFQAAYGADVKAHDVRSNLSKKRTKALTQALNDAEKIGALAGLAGNLIEAVIKMGEIE
jgi:hypothetical protein